MMISSSPTVFPSSTMRFNVLFHLFLIALSVLPGRRRAISAHLFFSRTCASIRIWSSSALHASFFTLGSSWLCHRSLICFPFLPGISAANDAHAMGFPGMVNFATSFVTISSSSFVHGHLIPAFANRSFSCAIFLMCSAAASSRVALGRSFPSCSLSSMLFSLRDSTRIEMMRSWRAVNPRFFVRCETSVRSSSSMVVAPL
mmetsp:Transcript_41467/g.84780  ORF Transcript_41467/g.84780 Transcript_41467/m.84780 type:complete len:201 (+) Transcript_41467:602-1204(+)